MIFLNPSTQLVLGSARLIHPSMDVRSISVSSTSSHTPFCHPTVTALIEEQFEDQTGELEDEFCFVCGEPVQDDEELMGISDTEVLHKHCLA